MEISEQEGERYYQGMPSVTTVLNVLREPYLERWRGKVGNDEADRITKEAQWRGTLIHDVLSVYDLTGEIGMTDPTIEPAVAAYIRWREKYVAGWELIEQPFLSEQYGIGGTPDRVGRMKGEEGWTLVDVKSGAPSKKHALQTAGYALILKEHGYDITRRLALYLPAEKGDAKATEHQWYAHDRQGFLDCLGLYHYLRSA